MAYDWRLATPPEYDTCERCDGDGCVQCAPECDPSPLCNCGTCTPPHFTCIRED